MAANKKAAPTKATTSKPKRKAPARAKAAPKAKARPRAAAKPKRQGIQPGETLTLKSGRTITKAAQ